MNKRKTGSIYEQRAVDYLQASAYEILVRNYRIAEGEIDIIARTGSCLVFVEVKYRCGQKFGTALAAVDRRKQRKISRVALRYLLQENLVDKVPCRFDVIAIDGSAVTHIVQAFEYIQ
ncbi:MAG: YraN family protein [Lachnospiraceae bacterium]